MIIPLSLLAAFWFQRALHRFYRHLNYQIYSDLSQLYPLTLSFDKFLQQSKIQPLHHSAGHLFFLLCPIASLCLFHAPIPLQIITLLLIYLALLDYHYSLTDSRYIGLIFWLAFIYLLFYTPENLQESILNLLITSAFFIGFAVVTQLIYQKEMFGFGDVMLLIAITPLFNFEQMITLILSASVAGLGFALAYFCKFKCKIDRLPFIPFISLSTFFLFIVKL